jgi:hypothetical protein
MSERFRSGVIVLTPMMAILMLAEPASIQAQSAPKEPNKSWIPPKAPDGTPDLQGVWTNQTNAPLERPQALGAKEFYTPEELAERGKDAGRSQRSSRFGEANDAHYDPAQFGLDRSHAKVGLSDRTSIIIGPEGRLPPLLPEAQKRQAERQAANRNHQFDGPENRDLSERCIVWPNEGPPMLPQGYNANLEIVQSPGYVAIEQEMIHDVRIIPIDGRPHLPTNIRSYLGDSRGYWEGNTLVVDTTNFRGPVEFRGWEGDENLQVVERFTRINENTIRYQFVVSDPTVWGQPWSGELPITKIEGQIFEYACQEANYGIANILRGARATEATAAKEGAQAK